MRIISSVATVAAINISPGFIAPGFIAPIAEGRLVGMTAVLFLWSMVARRHRQDRAFGPAPLARSCWARRRFAAVSRPAATMMIFWRRLSLAWPDGSRDPRRWSWWERRRSQPVAARNL